MRIPRGFGYAEEVETFSDKLSRLLEHARRTGELLAVHDDVARPGSFEVGTVASIERTSVVFDLVSRDGDPHGSCVKRIDDIFKLEFDTPYLRSVQRLVTQGVEGEDSIEVQGLLDALELARDRRRVITLAEADDQETVGFVAEIGDEHVQVETLDWIGRPDGLTYLALDAIRGAYLGGRPQVRLEALYRAHMEAR